MDATSLGGVILFSEIVDLIVTYHEPRARNINRRREITRKPVSVKCIFFKKKYESHRKLLERCGGSLPDGTGGGYPA